MSHFVRHDILRDTLMRGEEKGDAGVGCAPASPFPSPHLVLKSSLLSCRTK